MVALMHAPMVRHWPGDRYEPAEICVQCTCGRWSFDSQASISGGIEPWGEDYAQHLAEVDQ